MHDVSFGAVLGEGGSAVVYQGTLEGTTLVAIKVMKPKLAAPASASSGGSRHSHPSRPQIQPALGRFEHSAIIPGHSAITKEVRREAQTLSALHHPNVVTHYRSGIVALPSLDGPSSVLPQGGIAESAEPPSPHLHYALVLESCDGGSLAAFLGLQRPPEPEMGRPDIAISERLRLATQTAAGLAHIHSAGLMHRDVKWCAPLLGLDVGPLESLSCVKPWCFLHDCPPCAQSVASSPMLAAPTC